MASIPHRFTPLTAGKWQNAVKTQISLVPKPICFLLLPRRLIM